MSARFELLLFASSAEMAAAAGPAGIDGVVVDWENRGKNTRQSGRDTQINHQTVDDLRTMRRATAGPLICRINGFGAWTKEEVEAAVGEGADEILLPMVRQAEEVERTLAMTAGRCRVGMLVETLAAAADAEAFADLPLSRVYVGLNDLAIERGTENLFAALADGTVERVRQQIGVPFGFGGLTLPDHGRPIRCSLLIAEMARLDCQFSFLRRSFLRDVPVQAFGDAVTRIRTAMESARSRTRVEAAVSRRALAEAVLAWG